MVCNIPSTNNLYSVLFISINSVGIPIEHFDDSQSKMEINLLNNQFFVRSFKCILISSFRIAVDNIGCISGDGVEFFRHLLSL